MSAMESNSKKASGMAFPSDSEPADGVFLTPRVLDQTAFREYSDSLRGLIREAGGKRNELRTDAEEARQLCENLTQAADRLRDRLETTAKLLPTLDNRVRRAEEAIEQAADHANLPARLETRLGEHIAAMELRVTALLEQTESKLAAAETRYAELHAQSQADLERLESIGRELSDSVAASQEHLGEINDRTARLREEVETIADRSSDRLEEKTEALVARADHALSSLNDGVTSVVQGANEHLADLEKKLEPFQANADQIPAALEVQVQKAVELIDAHAAETIKRVQAIEMLSERAVRLLGFDPDQPSDEIAPDSLMMLIQRGDELERTARGTANELAALHSVNEQVREQCSTVLTDTSGAIDKLANKRDEILSTIEQTLAGLDDAQPAYLGELLSARDQLAEIESRRSDVESDIGSVGEELARLENAVAEQLTNLRAQASEELSRLQVAVAAQRRSMAQLLTESPGESQPSGSKSNPNTESA